MSLVARSTGWISSHSKWVLLLLSCHFICGVLILHWVSLTKCPPVFIDEPWIADVAWTRLTTGVNFESMNAGPLDQTGYAWMLRNYLGSTPYVLSFALFGLGLFQARLVSFFFGVILLLVVIWVGNKSYSLATGVLAALLLSISQPFTYSSHLARPDIILAVVLVLVYGISLFAFRTEKWWAHFLAGLCLGLSLDLHENVALFIPGLVVIYGMNYKKAFFRQRGVWLAAAGGLVGIACYLSYRVLPNPKTYLFLSSYLYATVHAVPVQSLSLKNLLASLDQEIGKYHFYENNLAFALIGASALYLAFRRGWVDRYLIAFIAVAFASFVLFQGSKFEHYAILLYCFLLLMVAEMLVGNIRDSLRSPPHLAFFAGLLALFIFYSSINFTRTVFSSRNYDYDTISDRIASVIPPHASVLSSPVWWIGLSEYEYHSHMALEYYNFFQGIPPLEGIDLLHPDIILVDPTLEAWFADETAASIKFMPEPKFTRQVFEAYLTRHGRLILELDEPGYGHLRVYAIY